MFKKLFGRKLTPTNEGIGPSSKKVDGVRWVKKFALELTNMEGSPSYGLTHQLTVGSEVGNIIIADDSVSPRHCTFILQEEVVSVIDHGSVSGTFINGKKIPPGKYIILEETDTIKVGDLEVQIHAKNESVAEGIPEEDFLDDQDSQEAIEEAEESPAEEIEEDDDIKPATDKFAFFKKFLPKKKAPAPLPSKKEIRPPVKANAGKKKSKLSFSMGSSEYATNSLVRLLAVIADVLIAYSLYVILFPFDEFRAFVADVPGMIGDLLDLDWNALLGILNEEYPFVGEMLKELYTFFSATFHFGPLFILFIGVRLVSTLLFGVSISEAILGVRSYGNSIWKRIGGFVRVILGIFTGPFLIFDIPAVVSRRTFKEFMTFTHTYLSSKFIAILGVLLYLPLLVAIALLSPLIQGLELPEPIAINERLDMRVKVAASEAVPEVIKTKEVSKFLNLELDYDAQNISIIPLFKFSGQKKKLNYKPLFVMYHRDLQRSVQVELYKTFDLKELLSIGLKGDFFLQDKFPEIEGFVNASEVAPSANNAFKIANDEKNNRKFADEIVSFSKIAFELSAVNAFEQMQSYTPLIKGLMDYRSSFLALVEYKEFDQIEFIKLGNAFFFRISYNRQKPFDLIIPLIRGEGRIFKVEFDKKENLGVLRNKFYKFSMNDSNWFPVATSTTPGEALKPLQALDFFSQMNLKGDKLPADKAQALYGYYFEKSAEVLRKDDPIEMEIWKKSVEAVFTIMEKMNAALVKEAPAPAPVAAPEPAPVDPMIEADPALAPMPTPAPEAPPVAEDPRSKLFQNFQDLKDAVDNKNKEFFGIEASSTI